MSASSAVAVSPDVVDMVPVLRIGELSVVLSLAMKKKESLGWQWHSTYVERLTFTKHVKVKFEGEMVCKNGGSRET